MTQATMDSPVAASVPVKRQSTFNAMAPIGNLPSLRNLLEAQRDKIAGLLPKHVTPERLVKTMLVAANRTPDLLACTQSSLLETINRAAELGLDLSGTTGEAYPVPFNNQVKDGRGGKQWVKQCQLIIGYRGFVKLARQSGEVKRIDADVVHLNDKFTFRKGSNACCEFEPLWNGDRGPVVGAYAYVQFKDGGEQFDFMPTADIEKIRQRSKSGADKDGKAIGAWKTDWGEMAKKSVFRRVAKWLPLSTEKFAKALEQDDADYDLAETLVAQTGPAQRGAYAVLNKITSRPVSEGQTLETDDGTIIEGEATDEPHQPDSPAEAGGTEGGGPLSPATPDHASQPPEGHNPGAQPETSGQASGHTTNPVAPDVGARNVETPATAEPSLKEQFWIRVWEAADVGGITDKAFVRNGVKKWALPLSLIGKEEQAKSEDVTLLLTAISKRLDPFHT